MFPEKKVPSTLQLTPCPCEQRVSQKDQQSNKEGHATVLILSTLPLKKVSAAAPCSVSRESEGPAVHQRGTCYFYYQTYLYRRCHPQFPDPVSRESEEPAAVQHRRT